MGEKTKKKKKWNGKPTLPLNENAVCHRRSCINTGIVHFLSQQMRDNPLNL